MIRLSTDAVEVIVETEPGGAAIVYWGAPLGDLDAATLGLARQRPITHGAIDVVAPAAIVAEHASGFPGRPGLLGHRIDGVAWSPRFSLIAITQTDTTHAVIEMSDQTAELDLRLDLVLAQTLQLRATLTNRGERYLLDSLLLGVALPDHAEELMMFTGRWSREFQPARVPFAHGSIAVENRSGRSSQDHVPTVFAGTAAFGEWLGEVWGLHFGWSANHQMLAAVLPDGRRLVQFGELLHPGEVVLETGQSYTTPWLYGAHSNRGLTRASWGFHRTLRSRPTHPDSPRPVLINTWEAVYFDHSLPRLMALADAAARVGVERYVLDDGWFGSRRNDRSGLGDWYVSPDAHPQGLKPLIDHVRGLGMQFGIWVEPEMVNPDSELYRSHPEWALTTDGYDPVLARNQLVLNLAHPEAYAHILAALDALLRDHDIAFVKWDMNRHHVGGSGANDAAGSHQQTLALYRLLDELRVRHPSVEIESCSSGGGRVDFEILQHTDRVWTSDCNDALERQTIQRGVSTFLVPELMGAHIGPPTAHTTGRTHRLSFRALTAMFGHLGIEWNLLDVEPDDLERIAGFVALHKRFRDLMHHGDVVRFDPLRNGTSVSTQAYGVYAADRSQALVCVAQLATGMSLTASTLRLPDLLADTVYHVEIVDPPGLHAHAARTQPAWTTRGIDVSGRVLAHLGIQLPALDPESAILVHLNAKVV